MIISIMETFPNALYLIERTPGLFVPLLVKVVPVVWLNRVLVVRSHVTWVKSSRLQCYQRKKKVFSSSEPILKPLTPYHLEDIQET